MTIPDRIDKTQLYCHKEKNLKKIQKKRKLQEKTEICVKFDTTTYMHLILQHNIYSHGQ